MSGCGGGGGEGCGSSGCQQQQQQQQQPGSFGSWARRHGTADAAPSTLSNTAQQQAETHTSPQDTPCMKCKAAPAVATIRQHEPYCHACIETGIAQKARVSTKGTGLISPGDAALLALSGGAASAGLLLCMATMQAPPDAARPIRNKLPYQLSVLHIDCTMPAQQQQQLQAQLVALVTATGYTQQQPLLLHVSDVFCTQQELQQLLLAHGQTEYQPQQPQHLQQLLELVAAISDPTGREDLVSHLRDQLLLRSASVLGCSRLLRGDSASRMAVRIIADAAKGRGFSLPADIQNMDGRLLHDRGPAVLQPVREVTHKELRELCSYKGLPLLHESSSSGGSGSLGGSSSSSVNVLAERFVGEMEGSLPASIYTIIRTAAHLEPFGFSDAAALVPQAAEALRQNPNQKRKQQQQQLAGGQQQANGNAPHTAAQPWQLCSICRAPLPAEAEPGSTGVGSSKLCYSCNRQILQQVKPGAAAAKSLSLEEKMQRLKQLLPQGLLLEEEPDASIQPYGSINAVINTNHNMQWFIVSTDALGQTTDQLATNSCNSAEAACQLLQRAMLSATSMAASSGAATEPEASAPATPRAALDMRCLGAQLPCSLGRSSSSSSSDASSTSSHAADRLYVCPSAPRRPRPSWALIPASELPCGCVETGF